MSEGDRVLTEVRVKRRKIVQAVRASTEENAHKTVAIDQALYRYEAINLRGACIVELRYFGGYTLERIAELLQISPRTVKREWMLARAWLCNELGPGPKDEVL